MKDKAGEVLVQVLDRVRDQARFQMWNQALDQVWYQARRQVWNKAWDRVRGQVKDHILEQLEEEFGGK